MENEDEQMQPDPLLEKLKQFLFDYYKPAGIKDEGVVMMSTKEIWEALQRLYPNELLYSSANVAQWLHEGGYTFIDMGVMRFEWLLKQNHSFNEPSSLA